MSEENNLPVSEVTQPYPGVLPEERKPAPIAPPKPVEQPVSNTHEHVDPETTVNTTAPEYQEPTPTKQEVEPEPVSEVEEQHMSNPIDLNDYEINYRTIGEELQGPEKKYAKFHVTKPPYTEMDSDAWYNSLAKVGFENNIFLPSYQFSDLARVIGSRAATGILFNASNPELRDQIRDATNGAYALTPQAEAYIATVQDENREFVQEIEHNGVPIRAAKPRFKIHPDVKPTGDNAVLRLNTLLGTGGTLSIPLIHSGFWVTLKNPSDARLLALDYEIKKSRIQLGRQTVGAIFSNERVYVANAVLRLFNDCIHETSLGEIKQGDIFDLIKIQDLEIIAWGLACVIWPNGYHYSRSVLSMGGNDDKLVHGKIDLSKLQVIDRNALSEKQLRHMVKRNRGSMSDTSVIDYQNSLLERYEKKVELNESISIIIGSPSISDYLRMGEKWVQNCINAVNEIFTANDDDSGDEDTIRNKMINDIAKATILNQYRHYVKKIVVTIESDGQTTTEEYTDDVTIDKMIEQFCSIDEIRELILEKIYDFINESAISIIGTPTASDEETEWSNETRFPSVIPMDALFTFFILTMQKVRSIERRASQRTLR